jgi:hypothetical protein
MTDKHALDPDTDLYEIEGYRHAMTEVMAYAKEHEEMARLQGRDGEAFVLDTLRHWASRRIERTYGE